MDARAWARVAVAEPGWWQREPCEIDFDQLRAHVEAVIEAAVAEERKRCEDIAWTVEHAQPRSSATLRTTDYPDGARWAARHIAKRIANGR